MQSSERSLLMAKKEYEGIGLKGKVEEHYLYVFLSLLLSETGISKVMQMLRFIYHNGSKP